MLAFVDKATGKELRIKHKELYLWVLDPASVEVTCRGCGARNKTSWVPGEPVAELQTLATRARRIADLFPAHAAVCGAVAAAIEGHSTT
jgi:hypothetical protein